MIYSCYLRVAGQSRIAILLCPITRDIGVIMRLT